MRFYKPLFSIVVILVQLILSLISHYEFIEGMEKMKRENPELYELIDIVITYDTLFLFVLVIGLYEMTTKPSWFKAFIRILLISVLIGYNFLGFVPIEDFRSGVYNTAWFSAVVAVFLFLIKFGKYLLKKIYLKKIKLNA